MNYYRLKQTDFNGDYEYFKIVGVHNKTSAEEKQVPTEAITIKNTWPNPFKGHVNISFDAEIEGDVEVLIQNTMGEIVHKDIFPFHYGENTYSFENSDQLKAGIYFVTLWKNGKKFPTQRIVKI